MDGGLKEKKNKEILKQAGTVGFLYLMLCVGGAYESYFRGADLNFTARIEEWTNNFVERLLEVVGLKNEMKSWSGM